MKKIMQIIMEIYVVINRKYCQTCGKLLTSKSSRKLGIGPECLKKKPSLKYKQLEEEGQLNMEERWNHQ